MSLISIYVLYNMFKEEFWNWIKGLTSAEEVLTNTVNIGSMALS